MTALVLALAGLVGGLASPFVIARLPEPEDAEKTPYRAIASVALLGPWLGLVGAVAGVALGLRLGWHSAALPWVVLVPVGVALAYVDLRVRLLPNAIVFPAYAAVLLAVGLGAVLDRSWHTVLGAALGWAILGGFYFATWFIYPAGMGYGDVRLAGLLGLALGAVGLSAVIVGGWLGLFFGAMISLVLQRRTGLKLNAHGPGMVLGAFAGVLCGSVVARALGY